jgi:hypothetical protein
MWVFLAFSLGACALIVVWATGLAPDVGAVIGIAILAVGILIQMFEREVRSRADS